MLYSIACMHAYRLPFMLISLIQVAIREGAIMSRRVASTVLKVPFPFDLVLVTTNMF